MTNKKQTAVEWLAEVVAEMGYVSIEILEQAKEMERQQIIDAYNDGNYAYGMGIKEPEQHYNNSYK